MADFTLNDDTLGVLGGSQFTTEHVRGEGDFQDIQLRCYQGGSGEDMEIHWIELHLTLGGVTEE